MAIPGKVKGAGNSSAAQNVFKVVLSFASLDTPELRAYDDSGYSILHEIFTGTAVNGNIPMLSGVATTDGAPIANWKPLAAVPGGATINRLKGGVNYVTLAAVPSTVELLFNLCWEVPSDAQVPADLDSVISIAFTYAAVPPVVTWYFNDEAAGGTELVPVWVQITTEDFGNAIRPTNIGVVAPDLILYRPLVGMADNPETWVDEENLFCLLEEFASCAPNWYFGDFAFAADIGLWEGKLLGPGGPSLYVQVSPGVIDHFCCAHGDEGYIWIPNLGLNLELTTLVSIRHKVAGAPVGDIFISFRDGVWPGWATIWEVPLNKDPVFNVEVFPVGVDLTPFPDLKFVIYNSGSRDESIDWILFE